MGLAVFKKLECGGFGPLFGSVLAGYTKICFFRKME